MEGEMSFYLLAELSGWNVQRFLPKEEERVRNSSSYLQLKENVKEARRHLSGDAAFVVESFKALNLDTRSFYQLSVLETRINYLSLHSYPEYYVNPFAIDPEENIELDTIGDLMFPLQGEEIRLNDMILDKSMSDLVKKRAVEDKLEYYLQDMERIVSFSIEQAQDQTKKRRRIFSTLSSFLESFMFLLINVFMAFMFLYPNEIFQSFIFNPDPTRAMTYVCYLFPLSVFLYDLFFVLFHSYRARVREPYDYTRRFLSKMSDAVFEDLRKARDDLRNYIYGAINNRIELKGDIKDFSQLRKSYIDIQSVILSESYRNKKTYKILRNILFALTTFTILFLVVSFVIYILGIIFEVAV